MSSARASGGGLSTLDLDRSSFPELHGGSPGTILLDVEDFHPIGINNDVLAGRAECHRQS